MYQIGDNQMKNNPSITPKKHTPWKYGRISPLSLYEKLDLLTKHNHLGENEVSYQQMDAVIIVDIAISNIRDITSIKAYNRVLVKIMEKKGK